MNVKSIGLVFENDELVIFRDSDIQMLSLRDVTTSYHYVLDGDLLELQHVNKVFIVVKKQGNNYDRYATTIDDDVRILPFDRIMLIPDIAQINIYFDTGNLKTFYVKYKGDEHNELQKSHLYVDGALYIHIGE